MSPARLWAMVGVAILHVLIGFAFVTGFAQKFTKEGLQDLDVFDVTEEPPPPEEEPPPPEEVPEVQSPEVVVPPPVVPPRQPPPQQQMKVAETQTNTNVTQRADTQGEAVQQPTSKACPGYPGQGFPIAAQCPAPPVQEKTCPGGQRVPVSAQCPAVEQPKPPTPARHTGGSITDDDYPAAALRAEAQGTTRITLSVGPNGRATGCTVSGSSGNSALDSTACRLAQSRFRFSPATQNGQPVAGSYSTSIRWNLPDE
jgi:protein TonB